MKMFHFFNPKYLQVLLVRYFILKLLVGFNMSYLIPAVGLDDYAAGVFKN